MKTYPLNFYSSSDKKPEHKQYIAYIYCHDFYGTFEFRYGTVEYQWQQIDADGLSTGLDYIYDPSIEQPESTKLIIIVGDVTFDRNFLWIPIDDISNKLQELQKLQGQQQGQDK